MKKNIAVLILFLGVQASVNTWAMDSSDSSPTHNPHVPNDRVYSYYRRRNLNPISDDEIRKMAGMMANLNLHSRSSQLSDSELSDDDRSESISGSELSEDHFDGFDGGRAQNHKGINLAMDDDSLLGDVSLLNNLRTEYGPNDPSSKYSSIDEEAIEPLSEPVAMDDDSLLGDVSLLNNLCTDDSPNDSSSEDSSDDEKPIEPPTKRRRLN